LHLPLSVLLAIFFLFISFIFLLILPINWPLIFLLSFTYFLLTVWTFLILLFSYFSMLNNTLDRWFWSIFSHGMLVKFTDWSFFLLRDWLILFLIDHFRISCNSHSCLKKFLHPCFVLIFFKVLSAQLFLSNLITTFFNSLFLLYRLSLFLLSFLLANWLNILLSNLFFFLLLFQSNHVIVNVIIIVTWPIALVKGVSRGPHLLQLFLSNPLSYPISQLDELGIIN